MRWLYLVKSIGFDLELDSCSFLKLETNSVVMDLKSITPILHNLNYVLSLQKENLIFPLPNFKTKKVVHKTQVFELISELPLAPNYMLFLSNKEKNINIENQYQMLVLHNLEVHVWISFALRESQSLNSVVNPCIIIPLGLLNPIQGFF